MDEYNCEILIIGAGPAGCAAGIYCGRSGRNTIILKGKEPSALELAKEIKNWPGIQNITGKELLEQFRAHAASHESVRFIDGDVISLMIGMGMNMISTRTANITADAIIIATGRGVRRELIKGEASLVGYGVSYCALCDGPLYKERDVFLYGNDIEVIEDALILKQMGCNTHIITQLSIEELPAEIEKVQKNNIEIIDKTKVLEVVSSSQGIIEKIIVQSLETEEIRELNLSCLFIFSHVPSNTIFKKAGVELDKKGNINVNEEQETNIKGVFAAGDVIGGLFQVVVAAAEGAKAGINANKYVRQLNKEKINS
ncbi:MAG: NAD(P)/FAD-dependent oxidoreductase [Promethearchaeota archaeon]